MATKAQHTHKYRRLPLLLRSMREEAGLTQRELGTLLGKPQSWVFNCEAQNRRVDLAEFCDWCQACRVEPAAGVKRFLASSR